MRLVIKKIIQILTLISIPFLFSQSDKTLNPVYAFGKNFGSSDPPMFFVYHFVTLDNDESIIKISEPSGKTITKNKYDNDEIISNPKLLSTMITTAIGKWRQIKIAGESIQRRLGNENIIDLMKKYDFPNETDYVVLGEINTLSTNYEIDLKIMDVSTQNIIHSHFFQIQKNKIDNLREIINNQVSRFMYDLLKPFCGFATVKVDESSRDFIRWDYISIRPLKTQVGGDIVDTEDKDLRIVTINQEGINSYIQTFFPKSTDNDYRDYGIIWDDNFNTIPLGLLSGDYELVAFLNGNEEKFQTFFEIKAGQMTQIDVVIDYEPPPPPKAIVIPKGSLAISNMFEGVNINLSKIVNNNVVIPQLKVNLINDKLKFEDKREYIDYKRDKSELLLKNLEVGTYLLGAFTISNETFPGKYYTMLYTYEDTIKISKRNNKITRTLPDKQYTTGREIVVYLNPFPPTKFEKYQIFLNESQTPFSEVSNVGEVHIEGVSDDFSGIITIKRVGYEDSIISIKPGKEKLYLHADLTQKSQNMQVKGPTFSIPSLPEFSSPKKKINTKNRFSNKVDKKTTTLAVEDEKIKPSAVEAKKINNSSLNKKLDSNTKNNSNLGKSFGAFWGFPGGTLNGMFNLHNNINGHTPTKLNLFISYGFDEGASGAELGFGFNNLKLVVGRRAWENDFDSEFNYKGIMLHLKRDYFFMEGGIVLGDDETVYTDPQLVLKFGFMR